MDERNQQPQKGHCFHCSRTEWVLCWLKGQSWEGCFTPWAPPDPAPCLQQRHPCMTVRSFTLSRTASKKQMGLKPTRRGEMVPRLWDCSRTAVAEPSSIKDLLFHYGNGLLNMSGTMFHLFPKQVLEPTYNHLGTTMCPIFNMTDGLGPDCSVSSGLLEIRASKDYLEDISYDRLLRNSSVGFTGCSVVILLTSTPDPWPDCVAQRSTMSTLSCLLPRADKVNSHSSSQSMVLGNLNVRGPSWPLSQLCRTASSKITPGSCRLLLFHNCQQWWYSWVSCS